MKTKLAILLVAVMAASYLQRPEVVNAISGSGNSRCVIGHTAAGFGFWTWPANSRVNVYLHEPDFSEADVAAVRISAQNWDESAFENGSNVRFTVRGLTHEAKTAAGDMTLIRGNVFGKNLRHLAELQAHSLKLNRLIDYAVVLVDPRVKNPEVLTNVVAHEIGHTLGLLDCYDCSSKSTAMGMMKSGGESNGIEGPTACDKEVVLSAYRDVLARGAAAAASARLRKPIVDEGELPEVDDTPIVDRP